MKVITAEVADGKIDLPDVPNGTVVAVLTPNQAGVTLSEQEQNELSEALAEIRRGEWEDGHQLLAELRGLSTE